MRVRGTPFDLPLLIFMLTAAGGVWAAYDPGPAWAKLGMLTLALAVYYLIAWQPAQRVLGNAWGMAGVGAAVGLYFLLTYDWNVQPADLAVLNRLGLAWMALRPTLPGYLHPNVAGGLLAMLAPWAVAWLWTARGPARWAVAGLSSVLFASLLMTSARGAWLSLIIGLGVWALWRACQWLAPRLKQPPQLILAAAGGLLTLGGIVLILTYPGGVVGLANRLPGLASGPSRWELAVNTYHLASDFPFIGGGLRAFDGLYSRYALGILVTQFTYSHNLYLDVALEQGGLGAAALGIILLGSLVRLALARDLPAVWRWAGLISLLSLLTHGLIDDALYGNAGTPFLFVVPAVIAALTPGRGRRPLRLERRWAVGLAGAGLLAAALSAQTVVGSLWANLGAVAMARAELQGWPDQRPAAPDLSDARAWLETALAVDSAQPTAIHRLGLLAGMAGDYPAEAAKLERAYQAQPGNHGIRKALGYAYVWLGDLDQATPLLRPFPEVPGELETYAWWWGTQARPDLASLATQASARLAAAP